MARLISGSGTIGGGATQAELDAFVGTSNITTLGTIGTGEWQGDTVAVNQGGTGASTLTANYALLGNGTSAPQMIAPSTDGYVLTSTGSTWGSEAIPAATVAAGHVIYTKYSKVAAASDITLDSWENATNIFISIPAAICNTLSKIIVHMTHQMLIYQGSDPQHFAKTRIARTAPGSEVGTLGQEFNSGQNGSVLGANPIYHSYSICVVDEDITNAIHTYYLQGYADTGYCGALNPATTGANITVWGIK